MTKEATQEAENVPKKKARVENAKRKAARVLLHAVDAVDQGADDDAIRAAGDALAGTRAV